MLTQWEDVAIKLGQSQLPEDGDMSETCRWVTSSL